MGQACTAAQEVLKLDPGFSAKGFVNSRLTPFKDNVKAKYALATLRQLGLSE